MSRKKPLRLHIAVYVIIIGLLFSVIGVVVIYLNGIQTRQAQLNALPTTPTEEAIAPIDIVPIGDNITIVEDDNNEDVDDTENTDSDDTGGDGGVTIVPQS